MNCKPFEESKYTHFIVLHILNQQAKGFSCHGCLDCDVKNLLSVAALQRFPLNLGTIWDVKCILNRGKTHSAISVELEPNIVYSCHVIPLCFQIKEIHLLHVSVICPCDISIFSSTIYQVAHSVTEGSPFFSLGEVSEQNRGARS